MVDKTQRSDTAKNNKKDMYTAVLVSQIIGVTVLLLTFNLTVKGNDIASSELKALLSQELFTVNDIVESVKSYLSSETLWAVSGDNVSYIYNEKADDTTSSVTDETDTPQEPLLSGSGGEDLKVYEAASNTSFSPIRITAPIIVPIEEGRYTSYFGYRINPITNEFSFHTGLDIAANEGKKIRAVLSGRVLRSGEDGRAGKYIFLQHDDGLVTFYCHCSEIIAEVGAVIRQGETIARVGSTGWSTGPHLHFEVRKNNIRYDPLYILGNDSDC